MDAIKTLCLKTFLDESEDGFHLARTNLENEEDLYMHTHHDFSEFFVITSGEGIHSINGDEVLIYEGSFCFIRASDTHCFIPDAKKGLVITNLAISNKTIRHYEERYFASQKKYWTEDTAQPYFGVLSTPDLNEIVSRFDILFDKPKNAINLDLFILHLFDVLNKTVPSDQGIPFWLSNAIEQFRKPKNLKLGKTKFLELCERSSDHVNRVLQKYFNKTLTEVINAERLSFTAKQLTMTNAPLKVIYTNAGYSNHSYFFRIFKKKYGLTPLEYRSKNHKIF
ncbi:helix-turn-helix domain-containing protein [Sediminitomix flava]|uniref:AraC family transcriptional regulator n=1 Tax=Sediminitomix flava TaxID=379075 RepID=A0A316A5K0_SEDFL|nr:helix-turn-helix domain-containing protein [Sediminitomix flava]PWJ45047.1 AraC family transcriptional regulator [Sediminitomix flava]